MSQRETTFLPLVAYEPLVSGEQPVDKYLGFKSSSISATWTAWGGYWSLSFTLEGSQREVESWLEEGLGRRVVLYSPSGIVLWEGFVSQIDGNIGALSISYGPLLDTVANYVKCVYSTVDYSVYPPAVGVRDETSWYSDSDSIARYGRIELVKSVGGCAVGEPEQIAQTTLEEMREPRPKESDNLGSAATPSVTVTCLGFVHWLSAYVFNSTTTGEVNASTKIQSVLAADPNGFFSTNYNSISTNATQVGAWDNDDRLAMSVIKGITALGDSSYNRWLFGVYADRIAKYNVIPDEPEYQRRVKDPRQAVYLYGTNRHVDRWGLTPGKWAFYADVFVGRSIAADMRNDPRYLFIEQIDYTAPWSGSLQGGRVDRLDQLLGRLGLSGEGA